MALTATVSPKDLRAFDPTWRARMISGVIYPTGPLRDGMTRSVWVRLTDEERAAVLDRTAPLVGAPRRLPAPGRSPLPARTPAPSRATPTPKAAPVVASLSASFVQCRGCGAYFAARPARPTLGLCRMTPECQPSKRRKGPRRPRSER